MTTDEALKNLEIALRLNFNGLEILEGKTIDQMSMAANGIGPGCFPDGIRKGFDKLMPDLQPAAFIHDQQWDGNDGSVSAFRKSNWDFLVNAVKTVMDRHGAFSIKLYIGLWQAIRAHLVLRACFVFFLMASRKDAE